MLLLLQVLAQLVGVIRLSFQVQRMELLVVVPLFPFQCGSQWVIAVPKFSREDRVLQFAMARCFRGGSGTRVSRALQLSFPSFEHGVALVEGVVVIRFIRVCLVPCLM